MKEKIDNRYRLINREILKIMAMIFMLLDHAYMTVVNVSGFEWMTQIGRLAFPIFAFQIVEGYTHTSSRKRYIWTMFLFALISEIPYNLMMGGQVIGPFHQNVMFTFFIALLMLKLVDRINAMEINLIAKAILICAVGLLGIIVGTLTFVDYSGFGVLTVIIFYVAEHMPKQYQKMLVQFLGLFIINWVFLGGKVIILSNGFEVPEQGIAVLSLIIIWLYNGKKVFSGTIDKTFKYLSYVFYPLHILILSLIALQIL